MAVERGWKVHLTISPDGGQNWFDFDEMTSVNPSAEPETEELRTINKNGEKETLIVSTPRSYEVSGYWSKNNYSLAIVKKSQSLQSDVHLRFYPDKTDLTSFYQARCICSSFPEENSAEGFATYTATFDVQALPVFVGNVN